MQGPGESHNVVVRNPTALEDFASHSQYHVWERTRMYTCSLLLGELYLAQSRDRSAKDPGGGGYLPFATTGALEVDWPLWCCKKTSCFLWGRRHGCRQG